MQPNLTTRIHNITLKNPVLTASGTFGNGLEFDDFFDVNLLGGFITKACTSENREGNMYPRMAETPSGMLNSVGLQNKGVDYFVSEINEKLKKYTTNVIVNVSGSTIEGYIEVAEKINDLSNIVGIELNISCPNVKQGGMAFGTSPEMAAKVTKSIRKVYGKTLIVKLSPNVTNIADIAKAVEAEGADSVSLINTIMGMAIDANTRKPVLSTITGGLSGPAVKPVALRMVWQVYNAVKIPIIGLGGITNATDAVEFMLAGATAVQVGTYNFIDPLASVKIIEGLKEYCINNNIKDINEIIGGLIC
ncbi:MAG: dihydroorotate dehydrogenase [Lentimicrobiaceae bacterium]|nr:dihydroorotate dehydrogenase [Lentimicrobiaceae bacterium]